MVFACYLDDSYESGGSVMTLAGYFALTENWKKYEEGSKEVYDNYGIDVLHTKHLFHRQKQFKDWADERYHDLVQDLFILARTNDLIGVSYTIPASFAKTIKRAHKQGAQLSPLGILFVTLCGGVTENEGLHNFSGARQVTVFLEAGNNTNAGIVSNFNKQKSKAVDPNPNVSSIALVEKKDCRAIHLADFWAFFSRRAATKLVQNDFQYDQEIFERYLDPMAQSAVLRARHTLNILGGHIETIPGKPDQLRTIIERCYELGPPPSASQIAALLSAS